MLKDATLDVVPAYGRTYKNGVLLLNDWLDGKDFKVLGSGYFNIGEIPFLKESGISKIRFFQDGRVLTTVEI